MITLEQFKQAWYQVHVSHNPNYDRDKKAKSWRGSVITARTWKQAIERANGKWSAAGCNRCLPNDL